MESSPKEYESDSLSGSFRLADEHVRFFRSRLDAILGYHGVDTEVVPVKIVHRGGIKTMNQVQCRMLRRCQAIERRGVEFGLCRRRHSSPLRTAQPVFAEPTYYRACDAR